MDPATVKHGLVTTLGQASYVGATGSGLLLGMGLLGRSYGFAIDNLHAIGIVLLRSYKVPMTDLNIFLISLFAKIT